MQQKPRIHSSDFRLVLTESQTFRVKEPRQGIRGVRVDDGEVVRDDLKGGRDVYSLKDI